jgi:hypothetical protein
VKQPNLVPQVVKVKNNTQSNTHNNTNNNAHNNAHNNQNGNLSNIQNSQGTLQGSKGAKGSNLSLNGTSKAHIQSQPQSQSQSQSQKSVTSSKKEKTTPSKTKSGANLPQATASDSRIKKLNSLTHLESPRNMKSIIGGSDDSSSDTEKDSGPALVSGKPKLNTNHVDDNVGYSKYSRKGVTSTKSVTNTSEKSVATTGNMSTSGSYNGLNNMTKSPSNNALSNAHNSSNNLNRVETPSRVPVKVDLAQTLGKDSVYGLGLDTSVDAATIAQQRAALLYYEGLRERAKAPASKTHPWGIPSPVTPLSPPLKTTVTTPSRSTPLSAPTYASVASVSTPGHLAPHFPNSFSKSTHHFSFPSITPSLATSPSTLNTSIRKSHNQLSQPTVSLIASERENEDRLITPVKINENGGYSTPRVGVLSQEIGNLQSADDFFENDEQSADLREQEADQQQQQQLLSDLRSLSVRPERGDLPVFQEDHGLSLSSSYDASLNRLKSQFGGLSHLGGYAEEAENIIGNSVDISDTIGDMDIGAIDLSFALSTDVEIETDIDNDKDGANEPLTSSLLYGDRSRAGSDLGRSQQYGYQGPSQTAMQQYAHSLSLSTPGNSQANEPSFEPHSLGQGPLNHYQNHPNHPNPSLDGPGFSDQFKSQSPYYTPSNGTDQAGEGVRFPFQPDSEFSFGVPNQSGLSPNAPSFNPLMGGYNAVGASEFPIQHQAYPYYPSHQDPSINPQAQDPSYPFDNNFMSRSLSMNQQPSPFPPLSQQLRTTMPMSMYYQQNSTEETQESPTSTILLPPPL